MKRTDQEIREAIERTSGVVSEAAILLGMSDRQIRNRMSSSKALREFVQGVRENLVDRAERGLSRAVDNDDVTAIRFVLATLGKNRGYVMRQEVEADVKATATVHIFIPDNGRDPELSKSSGAK